MISVLVVAFCIIFALIICRAADTGPKIAVKAVFYLNTGSFGSPTWSAVSLVGDASISAAWDEGDASARASRLEMSVKTLLKLGFTAKIRADDTDTNFATIWSASQNDTILNVLILDGAILIAGPRGYWIDVQVFENNQDQGLKSVIYNEFQFKPTPTANAQSYVTISNVNTISSTAIGS